MSNLRVGVIGCGYWGPNLIRNFVELPTAELVAVADLDSKRLAHIQSRYPGTKVTADYGDLFSMGLDAVVVATPPATHHHIALDCLRHGMHVLVEKPLTLSSQDAEELIEEADRRDVTLMVGHTFEYNAAVRALKGIIDSGEIGELYYIDMARVSLGLFQRDLNVLWDLAPHDISILLYLLGQDPVKVTALGATSIFQGKHDTAHVHLEFPHNIFVHVHVGWLHPRKVRCVSVVGSRKMVVYDDTEPLEKIKIYDKGVQTLPYTDTFGEFQCSYRYGDVLIPHIGFTEPLRAECQHFVDCVTNGTEPQSSGRVGLKVVRILEAADRSLHDGCAEEMVRLGKHQSSDVVPDSERVAESQTVR